MKHKILIPLLLLSAFAHAQYVVNYKKVADTYFANKEYYAAATFYKKALKITADSTLAVIPYGNDKKKNSKEKVTADYEDAVYKLAEASRLYHEFNDAEKYYAIASDFTEPKYEMATFYYGVSLRANQKFLEAITAFEKYITKHSGNAMAERAKMEKSSCQFAINEMRYPKSVQLKKLAKNINSLGSNYAPIQYNGQLYFTSSRPVSVDEKNEVKKVGKIQVSTKANPFLNAIYKGNVSNVAGEVPVNKIDFDIPKDFEMAAVAFNSKNNTAYFTAWKPGGKRAIYGVKKNGDNWSVAMPLDMQINGKDYNTMQPFVTADGKLMFFSSDRPGGFGKYDLWCAVIKADGSFGQPVNLGETINTDRDEEAPYYNTISKKLIFSTNGRVGLGGLDFFEANGSLLEWTVPTNLGYPFNSSKDDVYFGVTNYSGTDGYISSDRESSCCLELFHFKRESITVSGRLVDCKNNNPLKDVNVTLTVGDDVKNMKTAADGRYNFTLNARVTVKLTFAKTEYFSLSKSFTFEEMTLADTLLNRDYCLTPFKMNVAIVLDNIYYEFNSAALTASSEQVLNALVTIMNDNPEMEIELGAHTDSMGKDEYNQTLSEQRASACVDYLISKNIAADRLTAKGYGESMPIAPNTLKNGKDNPEGRAKNRRTEFKVTKK